MKSKILPVVFLSLCLLLTAGVNCFAQDEAAYQKALAEAYLQKDPSQYRADALKKHIESYASGANPKTGDELLPIIRAKFNELAAIDFYAVVQAASSINKYSAEINKALGEFSPEQIEAIKRTARYLGMVDVYNAQQSKDSPPAYPSGVPQPGYGWGKTVSSNVAPQREPADRETSTGANSSPQTPTDFHELGIQQIKDKNYEAAARSYSECIRLRPDAKNCYYNRGLANRGKKDLDSAITDFTKYLKFSPQDPDAYFMRADVYEQKGNYRAALADYEEALKIKPGSELFKRSLERVKAVSADAGNIEDAPAENEKVNSSSSNVPPKNSTNAAVINQPQPTPVPTSATLMQRSANDYFKTGQEQLKKKEHDEADKTFTECLGLYPTRAICHFGRGQVNEALWQLDETIVHYTKAISTDPKFVTGYLARSEIYKKKRDYKSAIADADAALKISPNDATAKRFLELYQEKVRLLERIRSMEKVFANSEKGKQYAQNHFDTGKKYLKEGKFDDAAEEFTSCVLILPKSTGCYFSRSWAHLRMNEEAAAFTDVEKAIALAPEFSDSYYLRGLIYKLKGDKSRAIADYKKVLELSPNDEGAKAALKELGVQP